MSRDSFCRLPACLSACSGRFGGLQGWHHTRPSRQPGGMEHLPGPQPVQLGGSWMHRSWECEPNVRFECRLHVMRPNQHSLWDGCGWVRVQLPAAQRSVWDHLRRSSQPPPSHSAGPQPQLPGRFHPPSPRRLTAALRVSSALPRPPPQVKRFGGSSPDRGAVWGSARCPSTS